MFAELKSLKLNGSLHRLAHTRKRLDTPAYSHDSFCAVEQKQSVEPQKELRINSPYSNKTLTRVSYSQIMRHVCVT